MAEQIRDGTGSGKLAKVNTYNQLVTRAISGSVEHWVNHDQGLCYNLLFDQTPTGAGDCFLYVKNTSSDYDVVIEGFTCAVGSAEQILVKLNDTGTPSGGSTATPVNLNSGSGNSAVGTFQTGNDITGLSGGSTADKIWFTSAGTESYNFEQDMVLGVNGVFTLYAVTGAVNVRGTLILRYESSGA